MPKGQKQPVFIWTNANYTCGEHRADHKWPTVVPGVVGTMLAGKDCRHYFDNRFQARRLGWSAKRKEGVYAKT